MPDPIPQTPTPQPVVLHNQPDNPIPTQQQWSPMTVIQAVLASLTPVLLAYIATKAPTTPIAQNGQAVVVQAEPTNSELKKLINDRFDADDKRFDELVKLLNEPAPEPVKKK